MTQLEILELAYNEELRTWNIYHTRARQYPGNQFFIDGETAGDKKLQIISKMIHEERQKTA